MSKVIGMGNALVDVMTRLKTDRTLKEFALPKGSMQLISMEISNRILASTLGLEKKQSSGGSAANTIHGLANLGIETAFVGKIGKDNLGKIFENDLKEHGIKPILFHGLGETGRSIALVSRDAERTMATYLGAAADLHEEDVTSDIFTGYQFFHIEGYLVQNHGLIGKAMRLAKANGLTVSIDMASYNIVLEHKDFFTELLSRYVDVILANELEARELTGKVPEEAIKDMATLADIAVVKVGEHGSIVKQGSAEHHIGTEKVESRDSTGAGDLYGAGFLYGLCQKQSIEKCGMIGSILGAHVIEEIGAKMDESSWETVRAKVKEICCD